MNQVNLPDIDINLSKISVVANERDLKLWKQQATAKYCKRAYEDFRHENEVLGNKIKNLEAKIEKDEKKTPEIKALSERMAQSIIIASDTIDHLIQLKLYVEGEIISTKKEYEALIDNYSNMYKQRRIILEKNNILYNELSDITTKVDEMNIVKKRNCQRIIDQKIQIKQKMVINNKLIITNVVDFVKVISNASKIQSIKMELVEKKREAQTLLKLYEKQNEIKRNIQIRDDTERSELLKRSIQMKPELKMPIFTPVKIAQNQQKPLSVPKVNEINLLKKLKQRSAERLKLICRRESSNFLSTETKQSGEKCVEKNTTAAIKIDKNKLENTKNNLQQEMITASKINIVQNVVIDNNGLKSSLTESQKRPISENMKGIIKKKKSKKVSFGECLSQDDPSINILPNSENVVNPIAVQGENIQEVSSYFSKKDDSKSFQQGIVPNGPVTDTSIPQFCYGGDESYDITKDLTETSNEQTLFSMTRSPENLFNQTGNNSFFSWNNPNSQQTSFW